MGRLGKIQVGRIVVYSHEPIVLGNFKIVCDEFMFVQYMPIRMPCTDIRLPENLKCFKPLIDQIVIDDDDYIYLTAKRLFVSPDSPGNRPGWHIDGYGTDDKNYLWSDSNPTQFCIQQFDLSADHEKSLREMAGQARFQNIASFPVGSLLALDSSVVHRVSSSVIPGYRTFSKISVSKERYNLIGNAHNYLFNYKWVMHKRGATRNHTVGGD